MPAELRLPRSVRQHLHEAAVDAALALAADVAAGLSEAIARRGHASLVVPGGRTPPPFLEALSHQPLDWSRVLVCPSDERWVDATHPDSNEQLLRTTLLRNAAATARLIPLKTAATTPEAAIGECASRLAALPRPLDVVVLGVGLDGHFASLFPDAPELAAALRPKGPVVAAMRPPSSPVPRISLTLPFLLDSRGIALLTGGAGKARVLEQAAAQPGDPRLPVSLLLGQRPVPLALYHSAQ
ncbi:6-phosphogluconolactonase [Solimonas sp. SE-A11]|uniref:6-phosphogluconolactonase n=1 Tax=Solimonas sp. SE-A11 TaxID=3054954 RepID=UPI00259CACCA|nr:6-phosphogluconolactonase [Solimonas sp. SE-A11]MDM4769876.1 6-phosphogluconolactonase [Solimonas sp. SE-A11]